MGSFGAEEFGGQIGGVCFFFFLFCFTSDHPIARIHNSFFVFLNFNHFRTRSVTFKLFKNSAAYRKNTAAPRCSAWSGLASSGAPLERFWSALPVAHRTRRRRESRRAVVKRAVAVAVSRGLANRRRREKESSPRIHTLTRVARTRVF